MCGIAGIYHFGASSAPVEQRLLTAMASSLIHRGPDEEGVYIDRNVGLAHRRLRIIDLSSGRQPLSNEDGTVWISFNGEIYNYPGLRRSLEGKGHTFRTNTDTEAIVHLYEEYGERCVEQLRGMFAFAIWDATRRQLFLARDRVGIKPLYYYHDGRTFLFASEIKALLAHPAVSPTIDPCALDDYLTYLYVPGPKSIYQQIRKLQPGSTMTVSEAGCRERIYWDLSFEPRRGLTEADYAQGLVEKLRETVAVHLASDMPLGAFLSGGLDSSAVVGMMAGLIDQPVITSSIGFREAGFDELPYARAVAGRFQTRAHEKIIEASAAKILDPLTWHFDEPFADSSMIPTYYVSQAAREHVTVCLSGDGGDENFAGYRRYRFDRMENRLRAVMPGAIREPLFGLLGRLCPKADWLPRPFRAKTLLTNLSLSPERGFFHTMSWFTPQMKRALYGETLRKTLDGYDAFSVMQPHFDRTRGWDPLSRIQYVDIKTYLVDDILTKVDRASMAHALEVRVPLLDHEFMEYAAAIPASLKLRRGRGKHIFKQALRGLLPPDVIDRPKMGFSIPLAEWFRGELKPTFEQSLFAPDAFVNGLFNPEPIRHWWAQHQRGTRDYSYHLWALLMLERWGKAFIDRAGR